MGDDLDPQGLTEADVRRLIEEALRQHGLVSAEGHRCQPALYADLESDPEDSKIPLCPHAKIIAMYHEKLPELPRCKLDGDGRKEKTRAFWKWVLTSKKSNNERRATSPDKALEWIGEYFTRAGRNDLVMGRLKGGDGHGNWVANFDYLIAPRGRVQVIERTRERA